MLCYLFQLLSKRSLTSSSCEFEKVYVDIMGVYVSITQDLLKDFVKKILILLI